MKMLKRIFNTSIFDMILAALMTGKEVKIFTRICSSAPFEEAVIYPDGTQEFTMPFHGIALNATPLYETMIGLSPEHWVQAKYMIDKEFYIHGELHTVKLRRSPDGYESCTLKCIEAKKTVFDIIDEVGCF